MSYCVNCGVELEESARKCVLCNTEVLNPNKPVTDKKEPLFSDEAHIPEGISKKFVAYVISMVMLIPSLVCILSNIFFFKESFWSLHVLAGGLLAWIIFVFPFFSRKQKPYLMWGFDTAAVGLYGFFFSRMLGDQQNIFLKVFLPILAIISLQMLIYMLWAIGKKRHIILKVLHLFVDFAIFALLCGFVIYMGLGLEIAGAIGIIIFVSCLCIIGFLSYCYKSMSMRRYLSKRFFT